METEPHCLQLGAQDHAGIWSWSQAGAPWALPGASTSSPGKWAVCEAVRLTKHIKLSLLSPPSLLFYGFFR